MCPGFLPVFFVKYTYEPQFQQVKTVTDAKGKPLAIVGSFKGAVAQAAVYPSTVIAEAVRVPGAARIWFSHNHPSGTLHPSEADKAITRRIKEASKTLDISVLDHLIITDEDFYSFADNGLL